MNKNKKKKSAEKIFLTIVFLIIILFGAYVLRDRNKLLCSVTFGSYENILDCRILPGEGDCQARPQKICKGGVFDLQQKRGIFEKSIMTAD